jgi:hypothetical protein
VVVALRRWGRLHGRAIITAGASGLAYIAWYLLLTSVNAPGLYANLPVIPVSWNDVGSGVLAFAFTVLALGLFNDPRERAEDVTRAAATAALAVFILDVLVV